MSQTGNGQEGLLKHAEKTKIEREAHVKMLEMLAELAPESKRPIFSLPTKVSRVTDKISDLMMLAIKVDSDVEYATKACEFLDRVGEACDAFMEQAQTTGE